MKKPVLSIITVCRQAREALKTTMDQILLQSWREFEYLVIDGSSSDGTQELLTDYTGRFADAGISCRFLSEPDHGIYDAMNKGTRLAHGTWLLFLNAGDLLSGPDILQQIFGTPLASDIQILYGDTLCTYQNHQKPYPALPLDHITFEMPFCHQSAFIRRELLAAHPYDVSYKVCADHQFFLNMYLQKKTFSYRPLFISVYEIAGYSDQNKLLSHIEKQRMQKELGIFRPSVSWLMRETVFYLKYGIRRLFGQRFVDLVRKNRLR